MQPENRNNQTPATNQPATAEEQPIDYGIVRVMKNKTSIMVTIPKVWARALHWMAGDHVRQEIREGNIVLINQDAPARLELIRKHQEAQRGTQTDA